MYRRERSGGCGGGGGGGGRTCGGGGGGNMRWVLTDGHGKKVFKLAKVVAVDELVVDLVVNKQ